MALVYGKASVVNSSESNVDTLFNKDVLVLDESEADASVPGSQLTVITNYRGHTASRKGGRKSAFLGLNMLDLNALGLVAVDDLPKLAERIRQLHTEITEKL